MPKQGKTGRFHWWIIPKGQKESLQNQRQYNQMNKPVWCDYFSWCTQWLVKMNSWIEEAKAREWECWRRILGLVQQGPGETNSHLKVFEERPRKVQCLREELPSSSFHCRMNMSNWGWIGSNTWRFMKVTALEDGKPKTMVPCSA